LTEPTIPIRNLYYLFCYAWNRFEEAHAISTGAEDSPDLPNLLARVLVEGTRSLLRRGLDRGYLTHEEELSTIRGHVELGPTLTLHGRNMRRVTCSYDELGHDLLHNQLLKASLKRMAAANSMDPGLARELQRLGTRMPDVTDIKLSAAAFARVQLHRNNGRYDLLLKVCELAFACMIPDNSGSGYAFQNVLRDERKMARVFEDFVRNFYRASQRMFRVKPYQLEWQAVPLRVNGVGRLPAMRTDVYLEGPDRRIIIDTKYYADALQQHHGSPSFRSDNLYQLFAYLRNDAVVAADAPLAEGMLLYPQVQQTLDATYAVHGHRVRLATLDLAAAWPEVEARLADLLR
jgi:5-methylcytosine-specific restriction enzyme subunit McrC